MNEIITKYLLAGDSLMSEIHLRQPSFSYIACESLKRIKEYENLKKDEIQDIFIKTN